MPEHVLSAGKIPRWNLDTVFNGFDSSEYQDAKKEISSLGESFEQLLRAESVGEPAMNEGEFKSWLVAILGVRNRQGAVAETLISYCYAVYSTKTTDTQAMNELNAVEELLVPFTRLETLYLQALSRHESQVRLLIEKDSEFMSYRCVLEHELFWQTRQMAAEEESLAADLARSGASAWGRLQEQITSTADCIWDEKTGERKTLVQLRSLAFSPERKIREKAYRCEMDVCSRSALPVAAAINGIKGTTITLNTRRCWPGDAFEAAIEKSVHQGMLSRKALDALIVAMEESLPHWRRYLKAKARLMGIPVCSFFDLFAPVGKTSKTVTFVQAQKIIEDNFTRFSPHMGAFARKAFDGAWLDAEPRNGKVGGAYCTFMPLAKETRVLCNFDGSFSSVLTMAHELGHAYHAEVLKDEPNLLQGYPMTLAETASIFAETVVFDAELSDAAQDEKLTLLEMHLQDGCQILVDILSRYQFEKNLFTARKKGELDAAAISALMVDAQESTYGDGLDSKNRHPYLWLVKPHYYSSDLSFYNFPYAFGQLFALALYSRYREEGSEFAETYKKILFETGRLDAVQVTALAGFDCENIEFWRSGIALFVEKINEFEKIVDAQTTRG